MNPNGETNNKFNGIIRVSTVRSQNPCGFGGCIFSGYEIDSAGKRLDAKRLFVIRAKACFVSCEVLKGELWRVSGTIVRKEIKSNDGFNLTELEIDPDGPIYKERETGALIIALVANNPRFKGIGHVRMENLWNTYGNDLYKILDNANTEILIKDLGKEIATNLIEAWKQHVSGSIISFLQSHKIPYGLAKKLLAYHGANTEAALSEDPYCLLSFAASWELVDTMAQNNFGIAADDPRRLKAAIEESLYRLIDRRAHTCMPSDMVKNQLMRLLFNNGNKNETQLHMDKALADNTNNGAYFITDDGFYWPTGAYIMEEYVAQEIGEMVKNTKNTPSLFMVNMDEAEIDRLIAEFENMENERLGKPFHLTQDQRKAVHTCVLNCFSVLTGGAGTGKTTTLRCLYYVLKKASYSICQMALSGRAAKRMHNATGAKATTIAGYLHYAHAVNNAIGQFAVYVIDEASMLDLSTTFQIFRSIPKNKDIRIVMVGDPYQLPPIGAGLVFHVLAETSVIPVAHLTEVKRQEEGSDIPVVANAVRHGTMPDIVACGIGGVRFMPCDDKEIINRVLDLFAENPDDAQILSATKNCPKGGTNAINLACRDRFTKWERAITVRSNAFEGAFGSSPFRENDRVMFTENDWTREVNNGSIGTITEVYDVPLTGIEGEERVVANGHFEGIDVEIKESDISGAGPILQHGYAVTVHKAQGSQWPRIIFPVRGSRNLDRTLVYTAITRAEKEVVIVGDIDAFRDAVVREPSVRSRIVGFRRLLSQKLS